MNAWKLTWHGLRTVTALELRQRVRSRRWLIALAAWFLLIGGMTALIVNAIPPMGPSGSGFRAGPIAFGLITFFVLGMGLVIAPTFTATSINGDRAAGTLALLQATRLSALEIATGKLLAAWSTALVFLLVALPFLVWSMALGSISALQVIVCFAVVFAEVAVVCAVGLGMSALTNRTAGSTVLTYLSVVALTILSAIVLGLTVQFTARTDQVRIWGLPPAAREAYNRQLDDYWKANPDKERPAVGMPAPPFDQCAWYTESTRRMHPEDIWWLVAANPFVVVADAAPLPPGSETDLARSSAAADPLSSLRYAVRAAATPQPTEVDTCRDLYAMNPGYNVHYDQYGNMTSVTTADGTPVPVTSPVPQQRISAGNPVWPWGLAVDLLIGTIFFFIAARRLTVPYGVLPKGTRIA